MTIPSQFDLEQSLLSGIGRIQDMKLDEKQLRLLTKVDEHLWDILEPDEEIIHLTFPSSGQRVCGAEEDGFSADINDVTCNRCVDLHEQSRMVDTE